MTDPMQGQNTRKIDDNSLTGRFGQIFMWQL